MTALQELLGIELPIIQAPMAGVQDSALAIAVSNAGGLGSLPCAMLDIEAIRQEIISIKLHSSKPFNVNFFCHTPPQEDVEKDACWRKELALFYQELGIEHSAITPGVGRAPFSPQAAEVLAELKPDVVSFHFGLRSAVLMPLLRKALRPVATEVTFFLMSSPTRWARLPWYRGLLPA